MSLDQLEKYYQYLKSFPRFSSKDFLKLERIELLLKKLGHPERKLKGAQVAGTKGKGSVVAFLEKILIEAGYKVGSFYSPYLVDLTEEIRINGKPIAKRKMAEIIERLKPLVSEIEKETGDRLTWFELVTVIATLNFVESKVDLVVVEVGLGGRLDATTALNLNTKIITNVSYDHTTTLGKTIASIAREKMGIIKKGDSVITSAKNKTLSLIRRKVKKPNGSLLVVGEDINYQVNKVNLRGTYLDFNAQGEKYKNLHLTLIGRHQAENFACAFGAVQVLRKKGFIIKPQAIIKAAGKVEHQARFHIWKKNPLIILDGAHNLYSIKALVETLKDVKINPQKTVFIYGSKKRKKQIPSILRELSSFSKKIIFPDLSHYPDLEDFYTVKKLKKYHPTGKISASLSKSIKQAKKLVGRKGIVVICGSLYMIGEILRIEKGIRTKRRIDDNIIESTRK